jgi:hypothetical protein
VKRLTCQFVRLGILCAALALACGLVLAGPASACNIPVFRYALERWRPDPYRVTVFHSGKLTEAQQRLVDRLDPSSLSAPSDAIPANLTLRIVDVDEIEDDVDRKLLAETKSQESLRFVVQYPESLRIEKPIAAGPLSETAIAAALASPLRAELVRRLAAGQTAVWLLLESGDKAKDDAAAKLLTDELQAVSKTLELPELSDAPEDNLLSAAPLGIHFSLLRVARSTAEQTLVDSLLASEPDLHEFKEPLVFPVFGRGRALLPLVGAGITTDNIGQSAQFLVGACSCEVKELNPGFDLLLSADWETLLFQTPEAVEAARLAVAKTAAPSGKPELVPIPAGAASPAKALQPSSVAQASAVSVKAKPRASANPVSASSPSPQSNSRQNILGEPLLWGSVVALAILVFSAFALRRR